ncbi:MAG: SAM-dependent methyltransferase [Bacteroidales bacterium]|jgi:2-polyprenyl-3-methyl-5-hydroxy-6-metoxy-1,4-benzoquinol methylase|nr:SAM-dependent methyltransferase [Bacteroidales bacterium]
MIKPAIQHVLSTLQSFNFDTLDISDYNRAYIKRLSPNLSYYMDIYTQMIRMSGQQPQSGLYAVDFGGGHGFLSMLLKACGYNVIYVDINPLSAHTAKVIKEKTGLGADIILEGSTEDLYKFCEQNNIKPQIFFAADLIEHVYNLDKFFLRLKNINPKMEMIFTTASNHLNIYKCHKLHKEQKQDEKDFFMQRKVFIENNFPKITDAELWARRTRGMRFDDIRQAAENGILPSKPKNKYNTCDPKSGNWTERILSFGAYRNITGKNGFNVTFQKGYYNTKRNNILFSFLCKTMNIVIRFSGSAGYFIAPYILLRVATLEKNH